MTNESHHEIHFVMEYDSKHKKLAVFGDYHITNVMWVYSPGRKAGSKGFWERKSPKGDACPTDQHFPVAFDSDNGVFLLVPDKVRDKRDVKGRFLPPSESQAFVYDLGQYLPETASGGYGAAWHELYDGL
jgi:hypothetical protein